MCSFNECQEQLNARSLNAARDSVKAVNRIITMSKSSFRAPRKDVVKGTCAQGVPGSSSHCDVHVMVTR